VSSRLDEWKHWRDDRVVAARAPHGPLALTGTYWLADLREGLPGVPGRWELQGSCVVLTAARHDGLEVDNTGLDGSVRLCPDTAPRPSLITHGGRLLLLILRGGEYAVRIYDPASAARAAFAGIDAHPYDASWVLPARFSPYPEVRTVTVASADGRDRGLALAGTVAFTAPGEAAGSGASGGAGAGVPLTLQVVRAADGSLSAVFADAGGESRNFRFRSLVLPAPTALPGGSGVNGASGGTGEGVTEADFNRAHLPSCAFADHFLCPFPPPGNTLPLVVAAGEKRVLQH
jgi:uncharacterized protein (DUF1684 family)